MSSASKLGGARECLQAQCAWGRSWANHETKQTDRHAFKAVGLWCSLSELHLRRRIWLCLFFPNSCVDWAGAVSQVCAACLACRFLKCSENGSCLQENPSLLASEISAKAWAKGGRVALKPCCRVQSSVVQHCTLGDLVISSSCSF